MVSPTPPPEGLAYTAADLVIIAAVIVAIVIGIVKLVVIKNSENK